MTGTAPRGGVTPMSRRVMNLAHMVTQNARRHGDRAGFIWSDRSWTWREIDGRVSALAAGARRARHRQGRPHPRPFQELRRDVLVDVRRLPVGRGVGADQFPPDARRGRLSRGGFRRQGVPVSRRFSRPCRGCGQPGARIRLADRRRRRFGETTVGEAIAAHAGARVENAAVEYDDPAGSSSPRARQAVPRRRC